MERRACSGDVGRCELSSRPSTEQHVHVRDYSKPGKEPPGKGQRNSFESGTQPVPTGQTRKTQLAGRSVAFSAELCLNSGD